MVDKVKADLIHAFMLEHSVELTEVIDVVVDSNGIIGVGLITLSEQVAEYIKGLINA